MEHAIDHSSIRSPSQLLLQLLGQVQVQCTQCNWLVFSECAERHLQSNCTTHTITSLGLSAITQHSVATPLNETEKKIGNYMVHRMIAGTTVNRVEVRCSDVTKQTYNIICTCTCMNCRKYTIGVFVTGDYEFLTRT